jgi:hypothetical protein
MSAKQPRLVMGIYVGATCTINILGGASSLTLTIPTGTYWVDPILSGIVTAASAGNIDAVGVLTNLLDAADSGATYTFAYASADSATISQMRAWGWTITRSTGTFSIRGANAGTNAEGKRFLRFIGADQLLDDTAALTQASHVSPAIWDPLRGEDGSPEEEPEGEATTVRTQTVVYAFDIANQLLSRVVSFPALKALAVKRRSDSDDSSVDIPVNFETTMWPWLLAGNPVRYWADKNALQNTYLSAAMSATATSFSIPVNSAFPNKTMVCVDGEWMVVRGGTGTTTVNVRRDNPVAHSKYAPVSSDFVGTYVIKEDGGNINGKGFRPKRRSEADDRWDFALALDRTAGV